MRILLLGAAGFIGSHLADELARQGRIGDHPIGELLLADSREQSASGHAGAVPTKRLQGDIRDPKLFDQLFARPVDVVFHLAATLTIDAETDFAHGLEVNVQALLRLLERCREQQAAGGPVVSFVFASSIATFGGPLPEVVDDHVPQTPQTSYGAHKVVAEQLINDYSRRAFIDGRALRLPVVLTHPGPANHSVSDRIAALIREPLNGRDAPCPLAPNTRFPAVSARCVARNLIALQALPADRFGLTRAFNMPSLTVTPAEIAASVAAHASHAIGRLGRIEWQADAQVQSIVDGWPKRFASARAQRLGIAGDKHIDEIVDAYLQSRASHG